MAQVINRDKRGDIISVDPMVNERTAKEYNGQLCAHRFDNLVEMDQFLERHNLSN